MTATSPAQPLSKIPSGYTSVTPWIISPDTSKLLDFVSKAFGAEELRRVKNQDGSIGHAEFRIGNAIVMAFDSRPDWGKTPGFLRLYASDCNAVYLQALQSGASSVTEPTDLAFGERVARVRDPQGNLWWIHAVIEQLSPDDIKRRFSEKKYVDAMAYVQSTLTEAMSVA